MIEREPGLCRAPGCRRDGLAEGWLDSRPCCLDCVELELERLQAMGADRAFADLLPALGDR